MVTCWIRKFRPDLRIKRVRRNYKTDETLNGPEEFVKERQRRCFAEGPSVPHSFPAAAAVDAVAVAAVPFFPFPFAQLLAATVLSEDAASTAFAILVSSF